MSFYLEHTQTYYVGFVEFISQDILVGFDFATVVYANTQTGRLEVDLDLVHDVVEQHVCQRENNKTLYEKRESITVFGRPPMSPKSLVGIEGL